MWRQIKKNRTDHCFQRPRPLTLVHLQSWTHRLITKRLLMSSVWSCSWSPATVQNNKPPCCHASERVLCTKPLCRVFMSHPPKVQETVLYSSAAWPTYESIYFLFVCMAATDKEDFSHKGKVPLTALPQHGGSCSFLWTQQGRGPRDQRSARISDRRVRFHGAG